MTQAGGQKGTYPSVLVTHCCKLSTNNIMYTKNKRDNKVTVKPYRLQISLQANHCNPIYAYASFALTDFHRLQGETIIPRTQRRLADRAFSVAAPSEWNCLPDNVIYCQSLAQFLQKLKTHHFLHFMTSLS